MTQPRGKAHFEALVETYLAPVFAHPAASEVKPSVRAFLEAHGGSRNTLEKHGLLSRFEEANRAVEKARGGQSRKDRRIADLKREKELVEAQRDEAILQTVTLLDGVSRFTSPDVLEAVVTHTLSKPDRSMPARIHKGRVLTIGDMLKALKG